ncbi:hypothetical protein DFH94DRAFT_841759 [Russula ochroleuca]|uniref:Uncharacterized protein n=1 Tax=Russula ochroleuca TaxID=152965 RepID=A0A9P5N6G5_9AGAM|nr:hypothetical protein DFH94DRAFT_841759 [Russula ochroleuca]
MLQKDEFIDARAGSAVLQITPVIQITKLQSGRSDGHFLKSCYEELTFNYNVDCHRAIVGTRSRLTVGEDKWCAFLLPFSVVLRTRLTLRLKGSKKKSKKLDEDRILIMSEESTLPQMIRLRGFSLMTNIMGDYEKDLEILTPAIDCMSTWPLMSRNKAENLAEYSKVRVPVQRCTEFGNVVLKLLKTFWTNGASWRLPLELPKGMNGDIAADDTGIDWALPPSRRPEIACRISSSWMISSRSSVPPSRHSTPSRIRTQPAGSSTVQTSSGPKTAAIIADAAAAQKVAEERALMEATAAPEELIIVKKKKLSIYDTRTIKLDTISNEKDKDQKVRAAEKGKRGPPDANSGASAQLRRQNDLHADTTTSPLAPLSSTSLQEEEGNDAEMEMGVDEAMDLSTDEDDVVDVDADGDDGRLLHPGKRIVW